MNPDALVRLYVLLRDTSNLRSVDPAGRRGLVPCPACTCGASRKRMRTDVNGRRNCADCRKPWPLEPYVEARSGSQPRRTSGEHLLPFYLDVGPAIVRFLRSSAPCLHCRQPLRWHARCYVSAALNPHWTMSRLALEAARVWPSAPFSWRGGEGRKNVKHFVLAGRAEMSRRLAGVRTPTA